MQEITKSEMKILAIVKHGDLILVSGQMVRGDVYDETFLTCLETGGKWSVIHKARLLHGEALESGFRIISLKHTEGSKDFEDGFTLVSE